MSLDSIDHYPVMLEEVINHLIDDRKIIDCTFGGGGYSSEILKRFSKSKVIGIDRDDAVYNFAKDLKTKYPNRFNFHNIKFSELSKIEDLSLVDYFIFDLGVSNFQLKDMRRGFSFHSNSKLHMGMGLNNFNAYDLLNQISEKDLKFILKYFGDEKFCSQIAKKVINYRADKKIITASQFSEIINSIKFQKGRSNPSTKSFQAIRMVVNQELTEIYKSLSYIIENSKKNSVIIVVTFHSLEDLLVKKIFNFYGKKLSISRYLPDKTKIDQLPFEIVTKRPLRPTKLEIEKNPSSRSAKLRVIKKLMNPSIKLQREDLNMEKYFNLESLDV